MDTDLSPQIKQFAAEHEMEIKAKLLATIEDFFDSSISENYHGKWDEGSKEHGSLTADVLRFENWNAHLTAEFIDAFWYQTLLLFRASHDAEE